MTIRLLRLAPWRRGPALLLRRPWVALALAAAALVGALPAAAAPLFLSSAQHATLHRQIDETCQWRVGLQIEGPLAPAASYVIGPETVLGAARYRDRQQVLAAHTIDGLTAPVSTGYGDVDAEPVDRPLPLPDLSGLTLLAREGFQDRVEVLAGPAGAGLWLPHEYATLQGIEVGDELRLSFRGTDPRAWSGREHPGQLLEHPDRGLDLAPAPVVLPVAAIYRDLRTTPDTDHWCGVADIYRGPSDPFDDNQALPMAMVDPETFLAVGEATNLVGHQRIELALSDPTLTAPQAAHLADELDTLRATLLREHSALFPRDFTDDTEFTTGLGRYEQRAALVRAGLLPPVLPITAAGTLVGLAVAAAAAVFWVQRRRRELTVLAAHGVDSGALGLKAVVEALPAVVAGAAMGWAAAWALVASVGPSPVLEPTALPAAAGAATATGLLALLLIGALATAGARGLADTRPVTHRAGWWRRVPWELSLLAAAPLAWWLLADDRTTDPAAGGVGVVAHVPARVLMAPILIIGGVAIFAARVATASLRRRGLRRSPGAPHRLLAWRRSVRSAAATTILAAATAVPVAMATFGATATGSINTTAEAQLRFSLGSDTVISYDRDIDRVRDGLPPRPPVPATMAGRATEVLRLNQQRLDGLSVDVLAVDPATFTEGAFWDRRIAGASLTEAVERLTVDGDPVVVANRRADPGPATLTVLGHEIPVQVDAVRPLPGAQSSYPMVLIDRRALRTRLPAEELTKLTPQVWVAGDPARTLAQVAEAELPAARVSTIDDQRAGAVYEPVTYTFQYLIALSVFTGLIGVVGLLLHLESRTAAHRRAYVMLRRLGLRAGAHRRAILLEVGVPVLTGIGAGLAGALAIAYGLRTGFDLSDRFPPALFEPPVTMAAVVAGAAVIVATGASLLTHARIARARPAEVLRDPT